MIIFFNLVIIPFVLFLLSLRTKYINSNILSVNSVILLFAVFVGISYPLRGNNFIADVSINSSYIYALFFICFYLGSLLAPNRYFKKVKNDEFDLNLKNPFFSEKNNFFYLKTLLFLSLSTRIIQFLINGLKYGFSLSTGILFRQDVSYALDNYLYRGQSIYYTICSIINQNLFYILLTLVTVLFVATEFKFKSRKVYFYVFFVNVLLGDFVVGGAYWTFLQFLCLCSIFLLLKGQIITKQFIVFFKTFKVNSILIKILYPIFFTSFLVIFLISIRTRSDFFSVFTSFKDIFTYYYAGNLITFSEIQESLRSGEYLLYANNVCRDLGLSCVNVEKVPLMYFIGPLYKINSWISDQSFFRNVWTVTIDYIAPFNTTHFLSFFLTDFGYFFTFLFAFGFGFYVKKLSNNYYKQSNIISCLQISFVCFMSNFSVRTWFIDSFAFYLTVGFLFLLMPLITKRIRSSKNLFIN